MGEVPRYGFVTNFADNYTQTLIENRLNLYHLDGVQFYDWEWKQHVPLAAQSRPSRQLGEHRQQHQLRAFHPNPNQ